MRTRFTVAAALLALSMCLASPAQAQAPKASELKTEIPALTAMHDVIAPMWHDAWPNKDTATLQSLTSKLQKHLAAIEKVELPGILREKTTAWEMGLTALQDSMAAYKAAAEAKDDAALLKAAESLHTAYESLAKVVRPVLKEMDDFHQSLYVLYHYQYQPLDLVKAGETVRAMKPKMDALNAAVLPDRLASKRDAFVAQRARLSAALDVLLGHFAGGQVDRIGEAIELMHLHYEKLEQVF